MRSIDEMHRSVAEPLHPTSTLLVRKQYPIGPARRFHFQREVWRGLSCALSILVLKGLVDPSQIDTTEGQDDSPISQPDCS